MFILVENARKLLWEWTFEKIEIDHLFDNVDPFHEDAARESS